MSFAALVACVSACGSSRSVTSITPPTPPRIATATSTSTAPDTGTSFCDLYRRDASDGRIRNWDLNDNAATPSYTETLRALDNAAPPDLKPDIARTLVHYEAPQRDISWAGYEAALASGERVLAYVHQTCGIDTETSTPPGDAQTTTP